MKNWQKAIALGLCASLLSAAALAETAESTVTGQPSPAAAEQQMPETSGQQMPGMPGQDQQLPPQGGPMGMPPQMPMMPGPNGSGQQMPPQSGMPGPNEQNGQMPALPEQNSEDGQMTAPPDRQNGERPELPDGQNGMPSGMPGGPGGMPGGMGGPGMESGAAEYTAANTLSESADNGTYASDTDGENAVLVSGSEVTLSGASVTKTGSSSSESADFYGNNAAVLAVDGATLTLADATITSDGGHANGVFSYGSGTTVNVTDTVIETSGNNSGGLMTTGGGTLNAENVTVETVGNSSAAIRSDRGGGTVNVSGGSYGTAGVGSPAIYSTADITVSDASLRASASEAVVIEGGNSVTLNGVDITGSNTVLNGQSTVKTNVLIYQSMSGDASEGTSTFTMTGGAMTAETGAMFHVTNTTATITLENVDFTYAEDSAVFLDASADSWGKTGANGGSVTLNLVDQDITGAILTDSVSSVTVNLDAASTWTLSGDSAVTALNGDLSQVDLNGYTLYVNGEAVAP